MCVELIRSRPIKREVEVNIALNDKEVERDQTRLLIICYQVVCEHFTQTAYAFAISLLNRKILAGCRKKNMSFEVR